MSLLDIFPQTIDVGGLIAGLLSPLADLTSNARCEVFEAPPTVDVLLSTFRTYTTFDDVSASFPLRFRFVSHPFRCRFRFVFALSTSELSPHHLLDTT